MTTIQSGNINTGTNTPTGARKQIAVDNPYVNKDEYISTFEAAGLGLTVNSPQYQSGELDRILLRASAAVNRYCRRYFDQQTIDETKTQFSVRPYNPQLVTVVLNNRPYAQINTIFIQVLQWFIQVDTGPTGYLQDFYDYGYYKIVPLLSSAGTGVGSPIPAQILDHVPLGVLWTNYTFGYGTPLTAQPMTAVGQNSRQYQVPVNNRLWAPSQPTNIYQDGTLITDPTAYSIDYPNGLVTFVVDPSPSVITSDFTTNESVPFDIKEAVILYATYLIGQARDNPLGVNSYSIQTFSINFAGKDNAVKERFEELLEPYTQKIPFII